jgi:hypothetical protein
MPGASTRPQPRTQKKKAYELVTASFAENVPAFPARMVLTVSFVVSLVIGLSCHHRRRDHLADLIPASRYQDATTSPSVIGAFVSCTVTSIASCAQRSVTIAKRPPWRAQDARRSASDLPVVTSENFKLAHWIFGRLNAVAICPLQANQLFSSW